MPETREQFMARMNDNGKMSPRFEALLDEIKRDLQAPGTAYDRVYKEMLRNIPPRRKR